MNEIASRYAEALYAIAKEKNSLEEMKAQAETLITVIDENPALFSFFRAVKVSDDEKKELIDSAFKEFDIDLIHFMKLLVDKDRTYYLVQILEGFVQMANVELGIELAEVFSVRKLPAEELGRITEALEKKLGRKVILKNKIDPSLIAGIKVRVGNTVTDASYARQLSKMKEALLKGGEA